MSEKKCQYCQVVFEAANPCRKFCCVRCKSMYGFRRKAQEMGELVCLQCTKTYTPKWASQNRFCSKSCELTYSHAHLWTKKEVTCVDCGSMFMSLRQDNKRCPTCKARHCNNMTMDYHCRKNPKIRRGVGSGGGQHYVATNVRASLSGSMSQRIHKKAVLAHGPLCVICQVPYPDELLVVHHIDMIRTNNALDNLTPLCPNCHKRVHAAIKTAVQDGKILSADLCKETFNDVQTEVKSRNEAGTNLTLRGQPEPKADLTVSQGQRIDADGRSILCL